MRHEDDMLRAHLTPAQDVHLDPGATTRLFQPLNVMGGATFLRIAGGST